jgi:hypothetical protein
LGRKDIKLIVRTEVQKALRDLDKTEQGIDDINRSAKKGTPMFKGLGNAVGGFISVLAVKEIAQGAIELAKLGAEARNVEAAFSRLPDSTRLLTDMRDNVKGGINDLELMRKAVEAIDLGANNEQLRIFTQFARLETVKKGGNVLQKFDNILSGVMKGSTELLDNFGLSLTEVNKNIEILAVEKLGKMASKLSTVERRELSVEAAARIMNKRLAATGDIQETNAEKIASADVAAENLKISMAKLIDTPVAETFDFWAEAMNRFNDAINPTRQIQLVEATQKHAKVIADIAKYEEKLAKRTDAGLYEVYSNRLKWLREDEKMLMKQIGTLSAQIKKLDKSTAATDTNTDAILRNTDAAKKALKAIKNVGDDMFEAWKSIYESQDRAQKEAVQKTEDTLDGLFSTNITGIKDLAESDLEEAVNTINALLPVWADQADKHRRLVDLRKKYIKELSKYEIDQTQLVAQYIGEAFQGPMSRMLSAFMYGKETGGAIWNRLFQDMADTIHQFLTSQAVATLLQFLANLIPGVGSAFSFGSMFVNPAAAAGGGAGLSTPGPLGLTTPGAPSITNTSAVTTNNNLGNFNVNIGTAIGSEKALLDGVKNAQREQQQRLGRTLNKKIF